MRWFRRFDGPRVLFYGDLLPVGSNQSIKRAWSETAVESKSFRMLVLFCILHLLRVFCLDNFAHYQVCIYSECDSHQTRQNAAVDVLGLRTLFFSRVLKFLAKRDVIQNKTCHQIERMINFARAWSITWFLVLFACEHVFASLNNDCKALGKMWILLYKQKKSLNNITLGCFETENKTFLISFMHIFCPTPKTKSGIKFWFDYKKKLDNAEIYQELVVFLLNLRFYAAVSSIKIGIFFLKVKILLTLFQ